MILFLVFSGFLVGSAAALAALLSGASLVTALVAYSLFGVLMVLLTAVIVSLDPFWPAQKPLVQPRVASPPPGRRRRNL